MGHHADSHRDKVVLIVGGNRDDWLLSFVIIIPQSSSTLRTAAAPILREADRARPIGIVGARSCPTLPATETLTVGGACTFQKLRPALFVGGFQLRRQGADEMIKSHDFVGAQGFE